MESDKKEGKDIPEGPVDRIILPSGDRFYILPDKDSAQAFVDEFHMSQIDFVKTRFANKDKIFMDIGANVGSYTINLANHFKSVVAFEPWKHTMFALCGGVAMSGLKNVDVYGVALGASDGVTAIREYGKFGYNSSTCSRVHEWKTDQINDGLVEMKRLDYYGFENIGVIKIDAEFSEKNILEGARETILLNRHPPIFYKTWTAKTCPFADENRAEVDLFLEKMGYNKFEYNNGPKKDVYDMVLATKEDEDEDDEEEEEEENEEVEEFMKKHLLSRTVSNLDG